MTTIYVNTPNKGTLNLRAEPSINAKTLAQIPYGTVLETDFTTGEWVQVSYKGQTGYVMCKFLGDSEKQKLQKIYDSLKETLKVIEEALK